MLISVDQGLWAAVWDRLAEAAGAVTKLDTRMGGIKLERRCTKARLETGKTPADCPAGD